MPAAQQASPHRTAHSHDAAQKKKETVCIVFDGVCVGANGQLWVLLAAGFVQQSKVELSITQPKSSRGRKGVEARGKRRGWKEGEQGKKRRGWKEGEQGKKRREDGGEGGEERERGREQGKKRRGKERKREKQMKQETHKHVSILSHLSCFEKSSSRSSSSQSSSHRCAS